MHASTSAAIRTQAHALTHSVCVRPPRQCRVCPQLVKDYLIGVKDASADPLLLEAQQELLTAAPRITKRAREEGGWVCP